MEKTFMVSESSELFRKIDALELSPSIRSQAMWALELADRIVGAVYWIFSKIEHLGVGQTATSTRPVSTKLKHQ